MEYSKLNVPSYGAATTNIGDKAMKAGDHFYWAPIANKHGDGVVFAFTILGRPDLTFQEKTTKWVEPTLGM